MQKSDDRIKALIVTALCYALSAGTRFLPYYEYAGLTVRTGWSPSILGRTLFVLGFLFLIAGTLLLKKYILRFAVQMIVLAVLIVCETIFMKTAEFSISKTTYGFWLNVALMCIYAIYCCVQLGRNVKKEKLRELQNI